MSLTKKPRMTEKKLAAVRRMQKIFPWPGDAGRPGAHSRRPSAARVLLQVR